MKTKPSSKVVDSRFRLYCPSRLMPATFENLVKAKKALMDYAELLLCMEEIGVFISPLKNQRAVLSSRMKGESCTIEGLMQMNVESRNIGSGGVEMIRLECIDLYLFQCAIATAHKQCNEGNLCTRAFLERIRKEALELAFDSNQLRFDPYMIENQSPGRRETRFGYTSFSKPYQESGNDLGFIVTTSLCHCCERYFAKSMTVSVDDMREINIQYMVDDKKNRGHWDAWCDFYLMMIENSAIYNAERARDIVKLYETVKLQVSEAIAAKWSVGALNFIFAFPVFSISNLAEELDIPVGFAAELTQSLQEAGLVQAVPSPVGLESSAFTFGALMKIVSV